MPTRLARVGPLLERWAVALWAVAGATFAHPICDLVFRCGCTLFSAAHCNVHAHQGPACPWCTTAGAFPAAVASWVLASGALVWLARRRFGPRPSTTLAAATLGFALGVVASGALTVWVTGYPWLFVR